MNKPALFLLIPFIALSLSFKQKEIKPSGSWMEYRREGSNGFCFDADGKKLPTMLVLEFKPKNIVVVKKSEDDAGTTFTYTQQDSVLQVSPTEKIIFSGEDYCRYTGYKPSDANDTYNCYLINKSAYKKLSEAKKSTIGFPTEADMKYKRQVAKEKAKKED